VKTRWFSLVFGLTAVALVSISTAGARPAGIPGSGNQGFPPSGTHGVAAKSGRPGTITITHYASDGVTVLSVKRLPATASDNSSSVAARLGTRGVAAARNGAITDWDDDGRPGAPVAQPESDPGARSTAAVKRAIRRADCCSSDGCDAVEVTRDITGDIFGDWIGTFHHRVYWCWSYPRITGVNVACWSDVDGGFIDNQGCDGWGGYYWWAGSGHGGHVSYRQGDWQNCIF
jgi:hypothetical protein